MIQHPTFSVEPWAIRETELHLGILAQTESVFALSNGHIGLRGNLDEGEPYGLPGTYLNGFYEIRPLPYAEAGYGNPESAQSIVNVTNGKIMRLLVEDEPFDVRYGQLRSHERALDFRDGVLRRTAEWVSPTGRAVRISSTRLVSFTQRAIAAIRYEVEPLEGTLPVVVQSELVTNEPVQEIADDPRAAAAPASPLLSVGFGAADTRAVLSYRTASSGLEVSAGMGHTIDGPEGVTWASESFEDVARVAISAEVAPGKPLRVTKFLSYGWSGQRSALAVRDQVGAGLEEALSRGWDKALAEQRAFLDEFWDSADVELEGDAALQQAIRFGLFHIIQAGARGERRAIPAKGLTGTGYDGHAFWDTEMFVLPVLTYTASRAAADALRWRHATLDLARDRAQQLRLSGASFPWRTIRGQECSGYWPAGTAAFHINADIADAVIRYQAATADEAFDREAGAELLIETARLWRSLGHHDADGQFRIDGVTGPDEYSAVADNNVYTNLMARRNLRAAADAAERQPEVATRLGVSTEETASWRDAATAMVIPYDAALEVHPQASGFTQHELWDFAATKPDQYPLLLHFPYFDLYRKQVVKQADLVLAMHVCGDEFTPEEKARNFDYYEALTVRDSSLSACTQAVIAAEVGHLELAYDYLAEAATLDLDDRDHNTRDGLHIASLAGAWIGAVAGLGGMRDLAGGLQFAPRMPQALGRLTFRLGFRGRRLLVDIRREEATYTLLAGEPLEISHHGEAFTVSSESPVVRPVPRTKERPAPTQPVGRAPEHRSSTQ